MATWVRQGTGVAPSSFNADLIGNYALDNASAPPGFDPAGVTGIQAQWTITGSGFVDDSWNNVAGCALVTGVTEISQHPGEGSTNNQNVARSTDHTDSTGIPAGLTVADWEAAFVRGDGVLDAWCLWNKVMGPDGSTLVVSALTVTITYTPLALGLLKVESEVSAIYSAPHAGYASFTTVNDSIQSDTDPLSDSSELEVIIGVEYLVDPTTTGFDGWLSHGGSVNAVGGGWQLTKVNVSDRLTWTFRTATGTVNSTTSTTGYVVQGFRWYRTTFVADNGANRVATFWYSDQPPDTPYGSLVWTLHATVTNSIISVADGTGVLRLGLNFDGDDFLGRIFAAELYAGSTPVRIANPDFRDDDQGWSSPPATDDEGNEWSFLGSVAWVVPEDTGAGVIHIVTSTGATKIQSESSQLAEADQTLRDLARIQNEVNDVLEDDLRLLSLIRTQNEVERTVDDELRFLGLVRSIAELGEISETTINSRSRLQVATESIQLSETDLHFIVVGGVALIKVETETVQTLETGLRFSGLLRLQGEVLDLTEERITLRALFRLVTEAENTSETNLHFVGLIRTETEDLQVVEVSSNVRGIFRIQVEDLQITETDLSVKGIFRIQDEILDVQDANLHLVGIAKVESELTNLSETILKSLQLIRPENETTQLSEADLRFLSLVRVNNEIIQLNETDIRIFDLLRLVSEFENIPEADIAIVTPFGVAIVKVQGETVEVSEVDLSVLGLLYVEGETTSISEADLRYQALVRLIAESSTPEESVLRLRSLTRGQAESSTLPEDVIRTLGLLRREFEVAQVQETPTYLRGLPARIINEATQLAESTLSFVALAVTGVLRKWRDFRGVNRENSGERDYNPNDRDYD